MTTWYTLYLIGITIAAFIMAAISIYAMRKTSIPGAGYLAGVTLGITGWLIVNIFDWLSPTFEGKFFWYRFSYLFSAFLPFAWLQFCFGYTHRPKWLTLFRRGALMIIPIFTALGVWFPTLQPLVWSDVGFYLKGRFLFLDIQYGPWMWVLVFYSYTLIFAGLGLLLSTLGRTQAMYRKQNLAIIIGGVFPLLANIIYIFKLLPDVHFNLTLISFTLSGLVLTWGVFRFHFLDLVPTARDVLVEKMPDGVIVVDLEKRIIDINPAAQNYTGYQANQLIGSSLSTVLKLASDFTDGNATLGIDNHEFSLGSGDDRRNFELRSTALYDHKQNMTGWLVLMHDISKKNRVESELKQSLSLLRATIESAANAILVVDSKQHVIAYNQKFVDMWHMPPGWDELPTFEDRAFLILRQIKHQQQYFERNQEWLENLEIEGYLLIDTQDGRSIECFATPYRVGKPIAGKVFAYQDVTKRERIQKELERNRLQLKAIFDSAAVGIAVIQVDGEYLHINDLWAQMLGYRAVELYRDARIRISNPEDTAERERYILAVASAELHQANLEQRFMRKDGSEFWGHLTISPLQNDRGRIESLLLIMMDMTDRKHAELALRESEVRFRSFVEQSIDGFSLASEQDGLMIWNPAQEKITGILAGHALGMKIWDLQTEMTALDKRTPKMTEYLQKLAQEAFKTGTGLWMNRPLEMEITSGDGNNRVIQTLSFPIWTQDGYMIGSITRDITETRNAEQAEHEANQLSEALRTAALSMSMTLDFNQVLDKMLDNISPVVPFDAASILLLEGDRLHYTRLRGYDMFDPDFVRKIWSTTFVIEESPLLKSMVESRHPLVLADTSHEKNWIKINLDEPPRSWMGAPIFLQERLAGFICLDKWQMGYYNQRHAERFEAFIGQATLALENARLFAETQQLAITDSLTGYFTRRHFFELAVNELGRSRRYARPLSILMLDVDHFKQVNDNYGHLVGDQVLQALTHHIRENLRTVDICGRYGGEEFVVLLPETGAGETLQVAERIRCHIAETPVISVKGEVIVTISIGVSSTDGDEDVTIEKLLDRADQALYIAKHSGRNLVWLWGQ